MSLLLEVSCERNSRLNVLLLTGLVSTHEQDDEFAISFGVVHPVPRPDINLRLADTFRQLAMLARIAMRKPVHLHLNASPRAAVFEPIDPIAVDLGDLNAHAEV
jgi:hypothetical protein